MVDEPMSTSCFSQPTSFCPKPLGWCACVPPGGTRAGEFTYGNRQRSTLPHTTSKANQGSRATWISVSKEASRGFRGRRRLPLVLLQFFPSGPEPFSIVGHPVKSILPHIVKGQQSGTRQKKGKSSLHTLGMSAVESRAKYLGVLGTRFAPPPTVRLNCSRAPYQEQRIMPHNVGPQCNDRCWQWGCQLWRSHKKFTNVYNAESQFQQISLGFSLDSVAFLCCI